MCQYSNSGRPVWCAGLMTDIQKRYPAELSGPIRSLHRQVFARLWPEDSLLSLLALPRTILAQGDRGRQTEARIQPDCVGVSANL